MPSASSQEKRSNMSDDDQSSTGSSNLMQAHQHLKEDKTCGIWSVWLKCLKGPNVLFKYNVPNFEGKLNSDNYCDKITSLEAFFE